MDATGHDPEKEQLTPEVPQDLDSTSAKKMSGTSKTSNDGQSGHIHNTDELFRQMKLAEIHKACGGRDRPKQIAALTQLATSANGLMDDHLRRMAWPILLGCDKIHDSGTITADGKGPPSSSSCDWQRLPAHEDEPQVRLDVDRSFIYYPTDASPKQLKRHKSDLSDVITVTLRRHPTLCYFQGFHDIAQVLLLVLGKDMAVDAVAHLSLLRIRDFMLPSLSPSLTHLQLLPAILHVVDPQLCHHLSSTRPFFALAATLTLYAHEVQSYLQIARLFDFLLAQEAVISIYLFAVTILLRRDELFAIPADEPEMLHFTLSKLPQPLDLDAIIIQTMKLFDSHPPEQLPYRVWNEVSRYSVLKTTRGLPMHTLAEGEAFFKAQDLELRRAEQRQRARAMMWKYRRPASGIGLAVLIGLVSIWLQRYHGSEYLPAIANRFWSIVSTFRKGRR